MSRKGSGLALFLISGTFLLGSCRDELEIRVVEADSGPARLDTLRIDEEEPDTSAIWEPSHEDEDLPDRIYYDLTRFEWYARGEPLRIGEDAYLPARVLVRAPASSMRSAGEYGGVSFYRAAERSNFPHDGSAQDSALLMRAVYVPVFEGFWLPFLPDTATAER